MPVCQGDIIKIEGIEFPVLVVSKDFFNQTKSVIVCPVVSGVEEGPLHIQVMTNKITGTVLCENLKYLDLSRRRYSKKDSVSLSYIIEITGAIQSIFDYV